MVKLMRVSILFIYNQSFGYWNVGEFIINAGISGFESGIKGF
jgi:hypothetical protein